MDGERDVAEELNGSRWGTGSNDNLYLGLGVTTPGLVSDGATGPRFDVDPLTCVARGTAIYLENLEEWKATMDTDADEG